MKIVLLTEDAPIYMPQYMEPIFRAHADHIDEVVDIDTPRGFMDSVRERLDMMGFVAFSKFVLLFLYRKFLDMLPFNLGYKLTGRLHSVSRAAEKHDLDFNSIEDVNSDDFVAHIEEKNPDLILSISCPQMLGEEILEIPERGCVNIHGSLLPKYRGRATAFWVLYNDEDKSGVTAHFMTPEFDAGEIVMQREFPIGEEDTMYDIYNKIVDVGSGIAVDLIDAFAEGEVETHPNNTEEGEYRSIPGPEERDEFISRGKRFI